MAASSRDAFVWAISQQESNGNYKAKGQLVTYPNGHTDRAYGKYQVMGDNIPSWTKAALGHSLTIQQWLNSPGDQEKTVAHKLGGYYAKYGAAGAAAMWYSGQPDPNKTYGNPPVRTYVKDVLALMARAPADAGKGLPKGGDATPTDNIDTGPVTAASYKEDPKCLVGMDIPVVGGVCILTKGQARAIEGGLLLLAGGIVAAAGLIILASYGLKATGALDGVAKAAAVVPGAGGLAARAASASGALKAGPKPRPAPKARPEPRPEEGGSDGNG